MTPRILIVDPESPRTDAMLAAFRDLADVVVQNNPYADGPPGPWHLVLVHQDDCGALPPDLTSRAVTYSGGGATRTLDVLARIPRGIPPDGRGAQLRRDEAGAIVDVITRLPDAEWRAALEAIWAQVPEAILLATLMLLSGLPLPSAVADEAEQKYKAERLRFANRVDESARSGGITTGRAGEVSPAGTRARELPEELRDNGERLRAFRTLIELLCPA